jgi:hypothetical protein
MPKSIRQISPRLTLGIDCFPLVQSPGTLSRERHQFVIGKPVVHLGLEPAGQGQFLSRRKFAGGVLDFRDRAHLMILVRQHRIGKHGSCLISTAAPAATSSAATTTPAAASAAAPTTPAAGGRLQRLLQSRQFRSRKRGHAEQPDHRGEFHGREGGQPSA